MTERTIWEVLGIVPECDRSDIRRAYARRLKETNPEDDPEAFQALRQAYELALALAGNHPLAPAQGPVVTSGPVSEPSPAAAPGQLSAPRTAGISGETSADHPKDAAQKPSIAGIDPLAEMRRRYHAACVKLETLLRTDEPVQPAALTKAFDAILAEEAFQHIGVQARSETWLAHLIAASMPRSDPLLAPAIKRFGWTATSLDRKDAAVLRQIVKRHEDLVFRQRLTGPGEAHSRAFTALARSPQRLTLWQRLVNPSLPDEVGDLLATIRNTHPTLLREIDPATLALWDRFLARPRLPAVAQWALVLTLPSLALMLVFSQWLQLNYDAGGWLLLVAPGIAFVSCFYQLLIAWPRHLWRQHAKAGRSRGLGLGFMPAGGVLILVAALLPPNLITQSLVILAASLVALWAIITGEPEGRQIRSPWLLRLVQKYSPFALWWLVLSAHIPDAHRMALSAAFATGIVVNSFGALSLYRYGYCLLNQRQRIGALGILAAMASVAAFLSWLVSQQPNSLAFSAAVLAIVVLAQEVPKYTLSAMHLRLRHYVLWGALILVASKVNVLDYWLPLTLCIWQLLGVAITIWGALLPALRDGRQAPRRPLLNS